MFGLLKSKLSGFINSVIKKGGEKKEPPAGETAGSGKKDVWIREGAEKEERKTEVEKGAEKQEREENAEKKGMWEVKKITEKEIEKKKEQVTEKEKKIGEIEVKKDERITEKEIEVKKEKGMEELERKKEEKIIEERIGRREIAEKKIVGIEKRKEEKPIEKEIEGKKEKYSEKEKKVGEIEKRKESEKPDGRGMLAEEGSSRAPVVDLSAIERAVRGGAKKEVKVSIASRITSIFSDEIALSEADVAPLFDSLELSLLEADVAYDVCVEMVSELKKSLIGRRVSKKRIGEEVKKAVGEVLAKTMTTGKEFDLVQRIKGTQKPAKILFVGPNGAGKTTTIAKMADLLKRNSLSVLFSASDTFRAAAIEQMQVHADKLDVKMVKSDYGSDPAAVAFDAVNYARAHNFDVVLIDSAGRQETNKNLIDELKKIVRVVKPDLKIYVGESFGGNPIIGQIGEFDKAVGLDGVILTKLDCDAKGGSAISVARATHVPVLYVGVGQEYADLKRFEPLEVARGILE